MSTKWKKSVMKSIMFLLAKLRICSNYSATKIALEKISKKVGVNDKQVSNLTGYGLPFARHGKITTTRGAVDQSNFHDYQITRMSDAPLDVRVHIVEDFVDLRPCGVGEPGVPPYTPALINAIHDATGKRIRKLPIGDQLRAV